MASTWVADTPSLVAPRARWRTAAVTLLVWLAAALSLTYWVLRIAGVGDAPADTPVAARTPAAADAQSIGRLLGGSNTGAPVAGTPAAAPLASRFVLTGVVASRSGGGAALIAVDGRPPRPYRVGSAIDENLVLQSVSQRTASIGPSLSAPPAVTLELPASKRP